MKEKREKRERERWGRPDARGRWLVEASASSTIQLLIHWDLPIVRVLICLILNFGLILLLYGINLQLGLSRAS